MILIDTNVVAQFTLAADDRHPRVDAWIDRVDLLDLFLPGQVVFETSFGIHALPNGRRRTDLERRFSRCLDLGFKDRIVPFDGRAALVAAEIEARRKAAGRPAGTIDAMIAGIAVSHNAAIATRNAKHIADLAVLVINPWDKRA